MAYCSLYVQLTTANVHDAAVHHSFISYSRSTQPKSKINVYLQLLIDELKSLWNEGVDTYDVHTNQTFKMKVVSIWTVNDFPAYRMLSRWST